MRAHVHAAIPEHAIPNVEARYRAAYGGNISGKLVAKYAYLRLIGSNGQLSGVVEQSGHGERARSYLLEIAHQHVSEVHGGGTDTHKDFVLFGGRLVYLGEAQDIRRTK